LEAANKLDEVFVREMTASDWPAVRDIERTERRGIWSIRSGIFPENEASLALHLACGFRVVGTLQRVGEHGGRWRDVVLLERRSTVVGTD
jgi:L-amino acid N-acyltransferase YncA